MRTRTCRLPKCGPHWASPRCSHLWVELPQGWAEGRHLQGPPQCQAQCHLPLVRREGACPPMRGPGREPPLFWVSIAPLPRRPLGSSLCPLHLLRAGFLLDFSLLESWSGLLNFSEAVKLIRICGRVVTTMELEEMAHTAPSAGPGTH